MSIKINFDVAHNPEPPTIVLAKRNGDKVGKIDAYSIEFNPKMNDSTEISFTVYRELNGQKSAIWDDITNFKLIHCIEWDLWFEIRIELDESDETKKTVYGTNLGKAELSQLNLNNIQINTKDDIKREDYKVPTVLYRKDDPSSSLLHRIMEKAPHYHIKDVDDTIMNIQRTFEFDDKSIDDAFQEIAEEIKCLFVYDDGSNDVGKPLRGISVRDLYSNCLNPDCKYRGDFTDKCPKCGSIDKENNPTGIKEGYGHDTGIFVTKEDLADDIQDTVDTGDVKNCFKLEAGDDLMTATIRNCNPNGTDYLWRISDDMKKDMSQELRDGINAYDEAYQKSFTDEISLSSEGQSMLLAYNTKLVDKYAGKNEDLQSIKHPFKGYSSLMDAYYNTVDLKLYLESGLMPDVTIEKRTAASEAAKLTRANLSPVAAEDISKMSKATADSVVLSMARVIVSQNMYRVTINKSEFHSNSVIINKKQAHRWIGCFDLEAVGSYKKDDDEEDEPGKYSATSSEITIDITDDYETFVKQKIDATLSKSPSDEVGVVALVKKKPDDFRKELKNYSLSRLNSIRDACETCVGILTDNGLADKETWGSSTSGASSNLYEKVYTPYITKLSYVNSEITTRQNEIDITSGTYDGNGNKNTYGLQDYIIKKRDEIQNNLDFKKYLDNINKDLWYEFCSFRRDDKYSNDNYKSDGLDNAELFNRAREFFKAAQDEIYKASEQQHKISTKLRNLLVIEKFKPLVNDFELGNWIRVQADDEIYKLRLIEYTIDFDDLDSLSVEFSDVVKAKTSTSDIKSVLDKASSMSSSYGYVKHQAKQGRESNELVTDWVDNGLALTSTKIITDAANQNIRIDSNGILCREYDDASGEYDNQQMKIINKGLYVTNDGWQTAKAGIGKFTFYNPKTGNQEEGYGVIAETIVGNLMLSKELGIYTGDGSVTLDEKGLTITSKEDEDPFLIQRPNGEFDNNGNPKYDKIAYFNKNGHLVLEQGGVIFGSTGSSTQDDLTASQLTEKIVTAEGNATSALKTANEAKTAASNANKAITTLENGAVKDAQDTADAAKTAASNAATAAANAAKTATDYLTYASNKLKLSASGISSSISLDNNGLQVNDKPYNAAASAMLNSDYSLTTSTAHLPLSQIIKNVNSAYSASNGGINVVYAGTYEVSGHISVSGVESGDDINLRILKSNTIVQSCSSISSGTKMTISISPTVVSLNAGQTIFMNAHSSAAGGTISTTSAVLTVKLLG